MCCPTADPDGRMGDYAIQAAVATRQQATAMGYASAKVSDSSGAWPRCAAAAGWRRPGSAGPCGCATSQESLGALLQIGNTPMIGLNDVQTETFYLADARKVRRGKDAPCGCACGGRQVACSCFPTGGITCCSVFLLPAGRCLGQGHSLGALDRLLVGREGSLGSCRSLLRLDSLVVHTPAALRIHIHLPLLHRLMQRRPATC